MIELVASKNAATPVGALLVTVSSLALGNSLITAAAAEKMASDRPVVWIELGPQLERRDADDPRFETVFDDALRAHNFFTPADVQQAPRYSVGGEARLTLSPNGSDWSFSAAVRYGRSNGKKHRYDQRRMLTFTNPHGGTIHPTLYDRSEAQVRDNESHAILDFQAGKDVGLGLFGGQSIVGLGVRFAQFSSRSSMTAYAQPYASVRFPPPKYFQHLHYSRYTAHANAARSFHGVGPSILWSGSTPAVKLSADTGFAFDWGVNAGVLFGRQRADGVQSTHERIVTLLPFPTFNSYRDFSHDIKRSRSVTVPNVGGSAAVSLDFPNAKLTLGYRADFFFGAMDTGRDAAKRTTVGFYGPYATISIGLGG